MSARPVPEAVAAANGEIRTDAAAGEVLPITARGIVVTRAGRNLIDGIDLTLSGGGVTAILGPNGAGKSMLLRVLANLVAPDRGSVEWAGRKPDRARAPRIGFVFQKPVLLRRSARANVEYALSAAGVRGAARRERAGQALEAASLRHLAERPARLLSGGEQQRLALARALSTPKALLLDEPTSSLDPAATLAIETLIGTARGHGTTIAFVTHDVAQSKTPRRRNRVRPPRTHHRADAGRPLLRESRQRSGPRLPSKGASSSERSPRERTSDRPGENVRDRRPSPRPCRPPPSVPAPRHPRPVAFSRTRLHGPCRRGGPRLSRRADRRPVGHIVDIEELRT